MASDYKNEEIRESSFPADFQNEPEPIDMYGVWVKSGPRDSEATPPEPEKYPAETEEAAELSDLSFEANTGASLGVSDLRTEAGHADGDSADDSDITAISDLPDIPDDSGIPDDADIIDGTFTADTTASETETEDTETFDDAGITDDFEFSDISDITDTDVSPDDSELSDSGAQEDTASADTPDDFGIPDDADISNITDTSDSDISDILDTLDDSDGEADADSSDATVEADSAIQEPDSTARFIESEEIVSGDAGIEVADDDAQDTSDIPEDLNMQDASFASEFHEEIPAEEENPAGAEETEGTEEHAESVQEETETPDTKSVSELFSDGDSHFSSGGDIDLDSFVFDPSEYQTESREDSPVQISPADTSSEATLADDAEDNLEDSAGTEIEGVFDDISDDFGTDEIDPDEINGENADSDEATGENAGSSEYEFAEVNFEEIALDSADGTQEAESDDVSAGEEPPETVEFTDIRFSEDGGEIDSETDVPAEEQPETKSPESSAQEILPGREIQEEQDFHSSIPDISYENITAYALEKPAGEQAMRREPPVASGESAASETVVRNLSDGNAGEEEIDVSAFLDAFESSAPAPSDAAGDSSSFDNVDLDEFIDAFNESGGMSHKENETLFDETDPIDLDLDFDEDYIAETEKIRASGAASAHSEFFDSEFGVEFVDETEGADGTGSPAPRASSSETDADDFDAMFAAIEDEGVSASKADTALVSETAGAETGTEDVTAEFFASDDEPAPASVSEAKSAQTTADDGSFETTEFDDFLSELDSAPAAPKQDSAAASKKHPGDEYTLNVIEEEETAAFTAPTSQSFDEENISVPLFDDDADRISLTERATSSAGKNGAGMAAASAEDDDELDRLLAEVDFGEDSDSSESPAPDSDAAPADDASGTSDTIADDFTTEDSAEITIDMADETESEPKLDAEPEPEADDFDLAGMEIGLEDDPAGDNTEIADTGDKPEETAADETLADAFDDAFDAGETDGTAEDETDIAVSDSDFDDMLGNDFSETVKFSEVSQDSEDETGPDFLADSDAVETSPSLPEQEPEKADSSDFRVAETDFDAIDSDFPASVAEPSAEESEESEESAGFTDSEGFTDSAAADAESETAAQEDSAATDILPGAAEETAQDEVPESPSDGAISEETVASESVSALPDENPLGDAGTGGRIEIEENFGFETDPEAETDTEFSALPEETEEKMIDFPQKGEYTVPDDNLNSKDLMFDDLGALESDLKSDGFSEDLLTDSDEDSEDDMNDKSNEILLTIAEELSSIKKELTNLKLGIIPPSKQELEEEPQPPKTPASSGFFSDDDTDETIALTGDELNNILITADFTEESGDSDFQAESGDASVFESDAVSSESCADSEPAADEIAGDAPLSDLLQTDTEIAGETEMPAAETETEDGGLSDGGSPSILDDTAFTETDETLPDDIVTETAENDDTSPSFADAEGDATETEDALSIDTESVPESEQDDIDLDLEVSHITNLEDETGYLSGSGDMDADFDDVAMEEPGLESIDFEHEQLQEPELNDFSIDIDGMTVSDETSDTEETIGETAQSDFDRDSVQDFNIEDHAAQTDSEEISADSAEIDDATDNLNLTDEIDLDASENQEEQGEADSDAIASSDTDTAEDTLDIDVQIPLDEQDESLAPPTEESPDDDLSAPTEFQAVQTGPEPEEDTAEAEKKPAASSVNALPADLKEEIKSVLTYMDQLLENLPEEKIEEFARSEHFEIYKKLFADLGIS